MQQWRYPFALLGIVFALIGYAFWPKGPAIPVLIYHDITTSTKSHDSYTVEASLLARELDYLKTEGYTSLSFANAQLLRTQKKLPAKPIIISFDDALPGHAAVPEMLRTRDMIAAFFIPSGLVGDDSHLNWGQVRAISSAGMEIGGHTANHAHPLQLTENGLQTEIVGDKQHIEAETGKQLSVFAYPFQEHNDATDAIVVGAGYTIIRDSGAFKSTVLTNSFESFLNAI